MPAGPPANGDTRELTVLSCVSVLAIEAGEKPSRVLPQRLVMNPSERGRMRRPRIALYSHDAMGLGHMRRNLLLADALVRFPIRANVLLISGARELNAFTMPPGVDCLTLPAFRKTQDSGYVPRSLSMSVAALVGLRAKLIRCTLDAFEPDVLVVDKLPRGLLHELDPTLQHLAARGRTRLVLGLRDVLDDPGAVRREWDLSAHEEAIRRFYHAVWIYGDPTVYDQVREYGMAADIAVRARFTGYLDPRSRSRSNQSPTADPRNSLDVSSGQLALCQMGGGQDGVRLAEAFAEAELPSDTTGVIVTGPYMPVDARQRIRRIASRRPEMRVLEFVSEPEGLLSRANRVVSMGGYNSICEILTYEKSALVIPRARPRREQLIRAERLRDLGLVDVLHPDSITSAALADWLVREGADRQRMRERVDFHGLDRLPRLVEEVLATPAHPGTAELPLSA